MKSNLLKLCLFLVSIFLLAVACDNASTTKGSKGKTEDGKEAFVEAEVFDVIKLKDQIVETIQNAPKSDELADLLNRAGASYIIDLTVPAEKAEKCITTTSQSLCMGMYSFDIHYANIYNRYDEAVKIIELENQLINKLGLAKELTSSEDYMTRIKENADNKDSVEYLVTQKMNFVGNQLASGDYPDIYALSYIGANIEALYILSQLTSLATNNSEMLKLLSSQKQRIKSVFTLMELMSGDESVKPFYNSMIPIVEYFEQHPTIGEEELKIVTPMIEKIHNSML